MTLEITEDGVSEIDLRVKVPFTAIARMNDTVLEKLGTVLVHSLKRARNEFLCAENGHEWRDEWLGGRLCGRCNFVEGELPNV